MTTLPLKLDNGTLAQFTPSDQVPPANLGAGARDGTKFLRDDGEWAVPPGAEGSVSSINGKVGNLQFSLGGAVVESALDEIRKAPPVVLSNGNLTATFVAGQAVVLGDTGRLTGKLYFEVKFVSGSPSGNCGIGLAPAEQPLYSEVGYNGATTGEIGAFQYSGNVYANGGVKLGTIQSFDIAGDVLCVAVDCDARLAWFRVNGGIWNGSVGSSPATGTSGFAVGGAAEIFPAISTDSPSVFTANFGGAPFLNTVPAGFSPWGGDTDLHALAPKDVLVASPLPGQALVFDGQNWINGMVATVSLAKSDAPVAPSDDSVTLFARLIAGRAMPVALPALGGAEVLQSSIWRRKLAVWNPPGNSTTVPAVFGMNAPTAVGTATARNVATTNRMTRARRLGYVSAATAGALAGIYGAQAQWAVGDGAGLGGFLFSCRFAFSDAAAVAGARAFVGLTSAVSAPANADPASLLNSVGVAQLSGSSTQLYLVCAGSAAQAAIPLGTNFPPMAAAGVTNGVLYDLTLFSPPGEAGVIHYMLERVGTSFVASGRIAPASAGVQTPATSALLAPRAWRCNNTTAAAVGIDLVGLYLESEQ